MIMHPWLGALEAAIAARSMTDATTMPTEGHRMHGDDLDIESELIDLRDVDLAALPTAQDSALAQALRRILRGAENPDEAVSAFQQSI